MDGTPGQGHRGGDEQGCAPGVAWLRWPGWARPGAGRRVGARRELSGGLWGKSVWE